MKKTLLVLLSVIAIISALFFSTVTANAETEGLYTYTVTNGEVTITKCDSSVSGEVVIPSTLGGYPVTKIGERAFQRRIKLEKVTLPESITSIGNYAFAETALKTAVLNDGLKTIGAGAFYGCTKLAVINIPSSVTRIDTMAFLDTESVGVYITDLSAWCNIDFLTQEPLMPDTCASNPISSGGTLYLNNELVTDIVIPENVSQIKDFAFGKYKKLNSVKISDNVTNIGEYAFFHCSNLAEVGIPASVKKIEAHAFEECGLTDIYYSGSSSDWSNIEIGQGNDSISSATIHYNYDPLQDLFYYEIKDGEARIYGYLGDKAPDELVYPSTLEGYPVTYIDCQLLDPSLSGVVIPETVREISDSILGQTSISYINVSPENNYYSSVDGVLFNKNKTELLRYPAQKKGKYYIVPNSVTVIKGTAFTNSSISKLIIQEGVVSIEQGAFYSSRISNIALPKSLTTVGRQAFKNLFNNGLFVYYAGSQEDWASITIGTSNEELTTYSTIYYSAYPFEEDMLTYVVVDNGAIITDCDDLMLSGDVVIPTRLGGYTVTGIGDRAFMLCQGLTKITLPNTVKSIGKQAFFQCGVLKEITLPWTVSNIRENAFVGCTSLTDVYYKDSNTAWTLISVESGNENLTNANIHYNCYTDEDFYEYEIENGEAIITNCLKSSANVVIPSTLGGYPVTVLKGSYLFGWFFHIESVTVPEGVRTIGKYSFAYCTGLKTISLPSTLTEIGDHSFEGCYELSEIILPESLIKIGDYAFVECSGIESVIIPKSVISIGKQFFHTFNGDPSGLKNVYYMGSQEDWNNISIDEDNPTLNNAMIHYAEVDNTQNGWAEENGTWYYYEKGVKVKNDWRKDSTGWCFLDEKGAWVLNSFVMDSVGWAYITPDGYYYETTGWIEYDNGWYYLEGGYRVDNAWRLDSTGWCFLGETGRMVTNDFVADSAGLCYIGANGYMVTTTGWMLLDDGWYYLENGYAVTSQWRLDSTGWCFLGETGRMVTNGFVADSTGLCYIGANGYMVTTTGWMLLEDGWYYLENGYAVTNEWRLDSKGWCYLGEDGAMYTSTWLKDSVGWCYIDESGYCLKNGTYTVDGHEYTFDAEGRIEGEPIFAE